MKRALNLIALGAALIAWGCSRGPIRSAEGDGAPAAICMKILDPAKAAEVTSISLTIQGPGVATVTRQYQVNGLAGLVLQDTVELPIANDLVATVLALDGAGNELYRGWRNLT